MANNVCFLYPQETYHLPTSIWSFEGGQIYRIRSFGVYASRCVSLIQRWNHNGLLDPTTMDDFNTTLCPIWASPKLASQLGAIALNGCWDHQVWPKAWSIRLDRHSICSMYTYRYICTYELPQIESTKVAHWKTFHYRSKACYSESKPAFNFAQGHDSMHSGLSQE